MTPLPRYTLREEIASSITHGVGAVLAIAGLAVLVAFAARFGDAWHVVSCSIFGAALILCFTTSTLYHSVQVERVKRLLRALDHTAIFLLIAGTYTPVCVVGLPGPMGRALLAVVWGGATLGLLHALFFVNAFRSLNVVLYVVLGCAVAPLLPATVEALGAGRTSLLVAGGVVYITGAVVYARRRPNPNPAVFGYHEVFHLMVIAASALHFASVFDLVVSL